MVFSMVSLVSPGRPMMKSPCTWMPTFLQFCTKVRPIGFEANDQQTRASVCHGPERLIIAVHARRAGPLKADRFEFLTERQHAVLTDVESVVVEEKFLGLRKHFVRLPEFARYVFHRAHAPRVAGKRLRPQAERTKSRTSARGVERNVRIQQERHIVFFDREMFLVNLGRER